jgi:hypothetical protein
MHPRPLWMQNNNFKVVKAWGLLLILSLLKFCFSSFRLILNTLFSLCSEVTCLIKTPLRGFCRKSSGFGVNTHKSA